VGHLTTTAASAPSARRAIIDRWWFRVVLRGGLALLALGALAYANDRYVEFRNDVGADLRIDAGVWYAWMAATIGAGFLFGLATWLPFAKVRCLWSRLLLAALALAPIAQIWWLLIQGHRAEGGWLTRAEWLVDMPAQSALAVLAGVAMASGFRQRA
jgi:hypothetical protein